MVIWTKTEKTVNEEGTTITYEAECPFPLAVESRKRHIPHSNGRSGTWDYTSYFVVFYGKDVAEKHTLKEAKKYAEDNYAREN